MLVLVEALVSPSKIVSLEVAKHLLLGVPSKPASLANKTQPRRLLHSALVEVSKLRSRLRASLGELQEALGDLDSHRLNKLICLEARVSLSLLLDLQPFRTLHHLGVSNNNSRPRVLLVKLVEVCFPKAKLQRNLDLQPHLLEVREFSVNNNSNRI